MLSCPYLLAQASSAASPTTAGLPNSGSSEMQHIADIEGRLNEVNASLVQTQQMLEKSVVEIQRLHAEINALRAQNPVPAATAADSQSLSANSDHPVVSGSAPPKDDLGALREEVEALQAEIKQHDQIKVETASKYPLRVSGLVLFNAFSNAGVVDNVELPTFALPRGDGSSHGSVGASMRQTLLALEGSGPRLGSARSSANISIDFFGGVTSNQYGYSASAGLVRLRQANLSLEWDKTTVEAGITGPLISPLSPTSFATVAQPALAGSGNLWTWSPQLRVEQRIPFSEQHNLAFEAGLIYPQPTTYTSIQLDSPIEASRRPGFEARISYHAHDSANGKPHPFVLGVGGYSASEFYNSTTHVQPWAVTGDWQIPITKWFELSGEVYRGRSIGTLGGGTYKDILTGTDTVTGLIRTTGVDSAGGWSQLKLRLGSTVEANAMFGMDDAFAHNFDGLILTTATNPFEFYARNQSVVGNVIFHPKTYLFLSPEYRHIATWRYTGSANAANIFTLTAGYKF
jgi:hypothetical protein